MKKFVFFLIFSLIVTLGYSQVADVGEFRIANATTAFGRNLPVGTKVYNIADGKYWVAIDGVDKTETLTTGAAKFELINKNVRAEDVPIDDLGGFYTGTDVEAALQEVGDSITNYNLRIIAVEGFDTTGIYHINRALLDAITASDTTRWGAAIPLEYATLQDVLIGTDTSRIVTSLVNAQRDSLVNVPYIGAFEDVVLGEHNLIADSIQATGLSGIDVRNIGVLPDGTLVVADTLETDPLYMADSANIIFNTTIISEQDTGVSRVATILETQVGENNELLTTPLRNAEDLELNAVRYYGNREDIYTDHNITGDSIFANYFNVDFSGYAGFSDLDTLTFLRSYTETDPIFTAWDKDYNDLINTPTLPIQVTNEVPGGLINGSNATFTTAYVFTPVSTEVFLNGVKQVLGTHYTEGSGQIVFSAGFIPYIDDILTINYGR